MAGAEHGPLLTTALHEVHSAAGARLVPFAGWSMPVQYAGILVEHRAVRSSAGLFDLSHMGRLSFSGAGAETLLQRITTNDVNSLRPGRAHYSLVCAEDGGILDDTILYNLGDRYLLVVNASNRLKLLDWIEAHRTSAEDPPDDQTRQSVMIGLQGPLAEELLQPICDADLAGLRYYSALAARVADHEVILARTGYTGEDGFELIAASGEGEALWERLAALDQPRAPQLCGLGARDTLRLEAGMPLYGHEIDEQTTPYEAGLDRVVKLDKGGFLGSTALTELSQTVPKRRLVGFQMADAGVPRQGYELRSGARVIGHVTSGTFSPTLNRGIGMAYLTPEHARPGTRVDVVVRDRPQAAVVAELPHVPHNTRRAGRQR